jgi:hypothetical protein
MLSLIGGMYLFLSSSTFVCAGTVDTETATAVYIRVCWYYRFLNNFGNLLH